MIKCIQLHDPGKVLIKVQFGFKKEGTYFLLKEEVIVSKNV